MEEEGEEVVQGHCLLEIAGPVEEAEGVELVEQWRSVRRMEEEGGEAGDGGGEEEEVAGDLLWWEEVGEEGRPEFLVWREVGVEEPRRGLWTEVGEEGLLGLLWMVEVEAGLELSCEEAEEEEGDHPEREVEGVPASSARSLRPQRLLSSQ